MGTRRVSCEVISSGVTTWLPPPVAMRTNWPAKAEGSRMEESALIASMVDGGRTPPATCFRPPTPDWRHWFWNCGSNLAQALSTMSFASFFTVWTPACTTVVASLAAASANCVFTLNSSAFLLMSFLLAPLSSTRTDTGVPPAWSWASERPSGMVTSNCGCHGIFSGSLNCSTCSSPQAPFAGWPIFRMGFTTVNSGVVSNTVALGSTISNFSV
mmetsp:Transcript_602/g.1984  ORF Transcript_602/g.1984 Transcript_602/m.1984 type:complete len:214 (+) Transcript_602:2496-3137(+)